MIVETSAHKIRSVGGNQSGKAQEEVSVAIVFACVQCLETGIGVQLFLAYSLFANSATGSVSFFAMHSSPSFFFALHS